MEVMISPVAVCCVIPALFMAGTVAGGDRDHEPQFTRPIGNLTAAVGREAVLACTVDHLGNHRVGWLRAEDQTVLSLHTSMVSHNPRITLTHDNYQSWQLHIRQVKESDKGCYMCQVNTKVMKKQIGCLDVHVPPDFLVGDTSGDMAVQEGDNATMICKATGNPQPRVTWKREDGQKILQRRGLRDTVEVDILAGEEMHFWKVDRRQMGSYLCIASNEVPPAVSKRVYLAVNFAPVIKVPNQLLGAPLYTTVTLECHVEAFPNTINYWVKNRQEMLLNGSKYAVWENQTGYYKVVMWLSILTFRPTDIGTYNCISTNSLGKAEGTLRLYGLADTSASESSKSKSTTTVESSAASLQFCPPIFALSLAITLFQLCRHIPLKLS